MRIQTYILSGLVFSSAVVMTGCIDSIKQAVTKKAEEAVVESLVNAQGKNVDLDIGNDVVSVTGEDGSITQLGTGATLPADWPKDIPMPDAIEITAATTFNEGHNVVFSSAAPPDVIMSFFQAELAANGWTIGEVAASGAFATLGATKNERSLNITSLNSTKGQGNTTTLSVQSSN